ncbi:carbon-monoxide dehydrogenase small subunit [Pseudonocardia thermophila]|uniref:Carbon-monoxide dehydrogenase small subunit n=1 Tax=Pseudonocardia thermophila TaxID=1848 RepID=A0A1M6T686_PSETH|nr:(2Fe-2S)-binding protein [Pseudonocardia thermophila]SHK52424.1 carbon-monoxide dehydrogenase small subunit [Pseudonocardia thermophila]
MNTREITVTVNGRRHTRTVEVRRTLADFLREDLGLTGTHLGCEHGVCGACTVIIDGVTARSCLQLAVQADGAEITTVEGVTLPDGELHPVQEALRDSHAFQCGFCTPGFVMAIYGMCEEKKAGKPVPCSRAELREELSGNICRCSGYQQIIDGAEAALAAAKEA